MSELDSAPVVLVEYQNSDPLKLADDERTALRRLVPGITITESAPGPDLYVLNPGGRVGAVQIGSKRFVLRPKIGIRRLLFLISYSMDPGQWRQLGFDFEEDDDLFEALIPGFAFQLERALRHGLCSGYRREEGALFTVRGQIRVADQIRNHFGVIPPVECAYDEFTDDIPMNQLLKAAIVRLGMLRIKSPPSRARLRSLAAAFSNVTYVSFDPEHLPEVRYDRANSHFRGPVEFARLILRSRSVDAEAGRVSGASFLINLATVFEDFVVTALRETLALSPQSFPQHAAGRPLFLDADERLRLEPDVSWWSDDRCVFVGDVKYKRTPDIAGVKHPDLYQLLAYTTATQLPHGLLIYAAGEETSREISIPAAGKKIEVATLDLDREPVEVLAQIEKMASVVRHRASAGLADLAALV
jgi:5-methylcytosine-specific restriction enzyme subunit McrC